VDVYDPVSVFNRLNDNLLSALVSLKLQDKFPVDHPVYEEDMPTFLTAYLLKFMLLFGGEEGETETRTVGTPGKCIN